MNGVCVSQWQNTTQHTNRKSLFFCSHCEYVIKSIWYQNWIAWWLVGLRTGWNVAEFDDFLTLGIYPDIHTHTHWVNPVNIQDGYEWLNTFFLLLVAFFPRHLKRIKLSYELGRCDVFNTNRNKYGLLVFVSIPTKKRGLQTKADEKQANERIYFFRSLLMKTTTAKPIYFVANCDSFHVISLLNIMYVFSLKSCMASFSIFIVWSTNDWCAPTTTKYEQIGRQQTKDQHKKNAKKWWILESVEGENLCSTWTICVIYVNYYASMI